MKKLNLLFILLAVIFIVQAQNSGLKKEVVSVEEETLGRIMHSENKGDKVTGDDCTDPFDYGNINDPAQTGTIVIYDEQWHSFTGPEDMTVTVSLCGSVIPDTRLEVWSDCNNATYDYYNDDACGFQSEITGISFTGGSTMYVKVYGYGSASGDYTLEITGIPNTPPVPLSNWPFVLIGLFAVIFVVVKFRR